MPEKSYYLPSRQLVSQADSAITERPNVPRSKFTGSWTRKTAFDAGYLVPFLVEEILPGDHVQYTFQTYLRMSTPLFPIMDNQKVDMFVFFVPNRLVWDNWARFMGEQPDPSSTIDNYTVPLVQGSVGGEAVGSLADHMGIPVTGQIDPGQRIDVNAFPFRGYNLIYNQWFRDQNLINSLSVPHDSNGPDNMASYALRKRAKIPDYFASALPWAQKFTAPGVPLAGLAPVLGLAWDSTKTVTSPSAATLVESGAAGVTSPVLQYADSFTASIAGNMVGKIQANPGGGQRPAIYADLSAVTGVAVNTFRQAFMVQSLLERDARGGTRYVELILEHFGVRNPDFRLQRPEYIGGGSQPLSVTPIAQTAPTAGAPLGALGGAATATGGARASYAATEHGFIIGLVNVRTELSYQQGLNKMWSRQTRYDYYWPSLALLGEQAVLRKEIYCTGVAADDATGFGFQERWHEYRTRTSEVVSFMRSTAGADSLDVWHLAQVFGSAPTLGQTFIEDSPPMDRILAADTLAAGQQYFGEILINRSITRAIPSFGTPATLGRF